MNRRGLPIEVTFVSTADGGRRGYSDLSDGRYQAIAAAGTFDSFEAASASGLFGVAFEGGPTVVEPGSKALGRLVPLMWEPATERVRAAGTFTVFEGPRIVARGVVLGEAR
jgi:hypothetical protein